MNHGIFGSLVWHVASQAESYVPYDWVVIVLMVRLKNMRGCCFGTHINATMWLPCHWCDSIDHMVWYGMVWYGMVWYLVWLHMLQLHA
jgi:hypothetical protein